MLCGVGQHLGPFSNRSCHYGHLDSHYNINGGYASGVSWDSAPYCLQGASKSRPRDMIETRSVQERPRDMIPQEYTNWKVDSHCSNQLESVIDTIKGEVYGADRNLSNNTTDITSFFEHRNRQFDNLDRNSNGVHNHCETGGFFKENDVLITNSAPIIDNYDTDGFSTLRFGEHCYTPTGRHHLPKIQAQNMGLIQPQLRVKPLSGAPVKKKKKRFRPFAAARERDRLVVMNSALAKLKSTLPLKDNEQKLSKKDILQTAILYIKFLNAILSGHESENHRKTVNLNKHNYIFN